MVSVFCRFSGQVTWLFRWFALASFVAVLSGCQTAPPMFDASKKAFAVSSSKDNGTIRISDFHIPKDEPGTTFLLVLAAAGGANINYPTFASVFDVTDQTRYIGTLEVYKFSSVDNWLEYEVPAGKRTLMLSLSSGNSIVVSALGGPHTDFIEVDVKPGGVNYIAVSRYGFARYPYLGEIAIADNHRQYCLKLTGNHSERQKAVEQYMTDNKINPYARDFKHFCRSLSDPKVIQEPTDVALKQLAERRADIENMRNETYGAWKKDAEKRIPYDLMRDYEPVKPAQPGQLM